MHRSSSRPNPRRLVLAAVLAGLLGMPAQASEIPPRLVETVRTWASDPTVLITLRSWNEKHKDLSQAEIESLDRAWRRQTGAREQPLIAQISGAPLSSFLLRKQAGADGRVIEIFVMDARGLNVGISSVTTDYWQGDEAKFQETFDKGPEAIHFGPVEVKDDSGHRAQQVSLTIADPDTGAAIGTITAEFDLDILAAYRRGD